MAKGNYSAVHKTSDGEEIASVSQVSEHDAAIFVDGAISELEGDSGASLTVIWED